MSKITKISKIKELAPLEASLVFEKVRNDEGATIPVGTPVYSKGEIGASGRIKVGIADASDSSKMPAIGITNSELSTSGDGQDGTVTLMGVYNTNISGFSSVNVNDIVYVAVGGGLTVTKPTGVNLIQNVGIVLKTNGTIIQGLQVTCIGRTNDTPNVIKFRNESGVDNTSIQYNDNDISTWQLQPENFYVNPQEGTPEAIFFKPDGTKMYILGRSGDDVGEYALSTAWDISTATYTDALTGLGSSPASEPNPYGMYISPDGIYLYIVGHSTDQVVQYTMSAAWDVSTASYTREQGLTDAGGTFANPTGIHFKPDGTMFWACSYEEDAIQQYTLSTAWDVSTLSVGYSFSLIDFFILNDFSSEGAVADISSSEDLFFSEDGTKVWLVENSYDSIHQLKLSTAWDIRTAVYDGKGIRHGQFESSVEGIYVNETAGKAFTVSTSSDRVRSFNFGGTVFSSANNANVGFDSGIGVKGNSSFSGATSFVDIQTQAAYVYGGFATYSTSSLVHGNGGTTNINDGTVYTGDSTLDVMTNIFYGANSADLSVQDTYIHNMNLGRPRGGAKVTLNIGRRVDSSGSIANHTGIMDVVSMAQTFDHYGSLNVGRTLQVDGKADLEVFDLGGTVVFNDTFTETNTTAIESHTPDLGAGWTKVFDTGSTTTFNIIGGGGYGQLSNSETSDGVMFLADTTPTGVDYEVRVDFKRRDSSDDVFLIIIKYQDANNYYALQWSASYSTYCKLFRVEGGSVVNVESNFNYGAMNSTADNLSTALKLRFIDNTLMVWDIDSNDYKSFRGSYPVTTDFNDGNGGTYHKVGMAFGDLFGGGLDSTTTWKIDKFEVKMLSSAATLAAATKSYVDAGNFGVGITSPTSKFHVVGDARIQGNLTVNGTYTQIDTDVTTTEQWLVTNDGTGPAAVINQKGSQDIFDVQDDGTSVFYIEDGGNVGIGTTSPTERLTIEETSAGADVYPLQLSNVSTTDSTGVGIIFNVSSNTGYDNARILVERTDSDATGEMSFWTVSGNSGTISERMRIDKDGNVGIGTTSPTAPLHIETADDAVIRLTSTDNKAYIALSDNDTNGYISSENGKLSLGANTGVNANNLNIDLSNNNVGIGTSSPSANLEIGSDGAGEKTLKIHSDTANSYFEIESLGNIARLKATNNTNLMLRSDGGGGYITNWTNGAERMRIDSSGNVGIGTTSPSTKLEVAGDLTVSGTAPTIRIQDSRNLNNPDWDSVSLGNIEFYTSDTTSPGARVLAEIEAFSNNAAASGPNADLIFKTSAIADSSPQTRLTIGYEGTSTFTGNVTVGPKSNATVSVSENGGADVKIRAGSVGRVGTYSNHNFVITQNGSDALTIDTSRRVGIGTSSPNVLLEVGGNVRFGNSTTGVAFGISSTDVYQISGADTGFSGWNSLHFKADGNDGLFIEKDTNNVGIGTTSPSEKLEVSGKILATGGQIRAGSYLESYPSFSFADDIDTGMFSDTANQLEFVTGGSSRVTINSVGNVGIGTTSPSEILHLESTAPKIKLSNSQVPTGYFTTLEQNYSYNGPSFAINSVSGATTRILLGRYANNVSILPTGTGNVGIGTSSPSEKLEVNGNIKIGDNDVVKIGDGNDFTATHDGTDTFLGNNTGNLYITQQANDKDIIFRSDDGSGGIETYFLLDGSLADGSNYYTKWPDNSIASFGSAPDLLIYHDGFNSRIRQLTTSNLIIENLGDDKDIIFKSDDGSGGVTEYFRLDGGLAGGDGAGTTFTIFPDNARVGIGNNADLRLFHNTTDSVIQNIAGDLYIQNSADDKDILFRCDDGSGGLATYLTIDGSNSRVQFDANIYVPDSVQLRLGSGNDLRLYHSTHSYISNEGSGDLYIRNIVDDKDIIFQSDDGSGGTTEYFRLDGGLGYSVASKAIRFDDNVKAALGSGLDLQLYHNGSHSYIENNVGNLAITNNTDDGDIIFSSDDGSGGTTEYFRVDGGEEKVIFSKDVEVTGNISLTGSVQKQISTTHHTFTFGAAGSASQDYWVPFIGSSELASPNVTHRTIAPYGGILKKAIVHSTIAYGSSAQVRFHRIDNGTSSVFANDNSTDDVTTNVTADMSTAYSSVAFNFTTGNTFSAGDQIGVSFVRDNTGLGDVAITLVWEYELF